MYVCGFCIIKIIKKIFQKKFGITIRNLLRNILEKIT